MLCFRCGSPVGDDATQCDNCGQDLTVDQSTVRPLPKVPSSPGEDTSAARAQRMQSGVAAAAEFAALQKKLRRQTNPGFGIADNRPSAYNVGEVVCERYEITDVIGGGGLGMVYKALDQEVEVDVALKVIDGDYLPDAAARERFLGEMQRLRELVHGNVVRYFDVDEDDGRCFYVTQFLEGLSLRKIMDLRREKSQRFSVDEVEPIITQLCQALEESAPIVHGGLKPQNIIILPDVLKLTDFGLPQALPRSAYMAAQRQHEGSVSYLAPELAGGDDPTPMSDVYSLGALIYELLSGDRYVGGAPALSVDDPSIPPAIDALLAQALADDPDARQGSAGELARHWLVATGKAPKRETLEMAAQTRVEKVKGIEKLADAPPETAEDAGEAADIEAGGETTRRSVAPTRASADMPADRPTLRYTSALEEMISAESESEIEDLDARRAPTAELPAARDDDLSHLDPSTTLPLSARQVRRALTAEAETAAHLTSDFEPAAVRNSAASRDSATTRVVGDERTRRAPAKATDTSPDATPEGEKQGTQQLSMDDLEVIADVSDDDDGADELSLSPPRQGDDERDEAEIEGAAVTQARLVDKLAASARIDGADSTIPRVMPGSLLDDEHPSGETPTLSDTNALTGEHDAPPMDGDPDQTLAGGLAGKAAAFDPPPKKEHSQATHQLSLDDLEEVGDEPQEEEALFTAQRKVKSASLDDIPEHDGEVTVPRVSMSKEELLADDHDEPLFPASRPTPARDAPSEKTQQIDADMIVDGEQDDIEHVLVLPSSNLDHLAVSGETVSRVADKAQPSSSTESGSGRLPSVDREARAQKALRAFSTGTLDGHHQPDEDDIEIEPEDDDPDLAPPISAVSTGPTRPVDMRRPAPPPPRRAAAAPEPYPLAAERSSEEILGDDGLPSGSAGVIEKSHPRARDPRAPRAAVVASQQRPITHNELPVAPEVLHRDAVPRPMSDVTHVARRPPPRRSWLPILMLVVALVGGGTVGAIIYHQTQRSVRAKKDLEIKRLRVAAAAAAKAKAAAAAASKGAAAVPLKDDGAGSATGSGSGSGSTLAAGTGEGTGSGTGDDTGTGSGEGSGTGSAVAAATVGSGAGSSARAPWPAPGSGSSRSKSKSRSKTKTKTKTKTVARTKTKARTKVAKGGGAPDGPKKGGGRKCYPGMAYIKRKAGDGYCIDRYEAPGRGRRPKRTSLAGAKAGCRARGLRLCTVAEWMRACAGFFPYGRTFDPKRCNTGSGKVVASGSKRGCRSRWGVYDLSGNVSEWTAGGSAMGGDASSTLGYASCTARSRGGSMTGYRCCSDPDWE